MKQSHVLFVWFFLEKQDGPGSYCTVLQDEVSLLKDSLDESVIFFLVFFFFFLCLLIPGLEKGHVVFKHPKIQS